MSQAPTAKLCNANGHVTLHTCVRLEIRGIGHERAIYPIYQCTHTDAERVFGCLQTELSLDELDELFPDVVLEYAADDDQDADESDVVDELAA